MKKPIWKRIWDAFCPSCDRSLSVRGGSSGFFWYCDHCIKEWRMTAKDEARIKNRRTG